MKKWVFVCVLSVVFLLSCAVAPKTYLFDNKFIIEQEFDEIWSAIMETFAERNIPIDNMEKVSGYISTKEMRFQSEWADCGTAGALEISSSQPLGSFNVFVKEVSPGNCTVTVNTTFRVSTQFMDNPSSYKDCNSTGEMESWFYETLLTKLGDL